MEASMASKYQYEREQLIHEEKEAKRAEMLNRIRAQSRQDSRMKMNMSTSSAFSGASPSKVPSGGTEDIARMSHSSNFMRNFDQEMI